MLRSMEETVDELELALGCPEGLRAARLLLEWQLAVKGWGIPAEIGRFFDRADARSIQKWAGRLALGMTLDEVFSEQYDEVARREFVELLEARFGALSREVLAGVKWLERWQLDEYRSLIASAASADAIVFRTGAQKLRREGYRQARS